MRLRSAPFVLLASLGLAATSAAQTPLRLADAIARARAHHPDAGSSAAAEREAVQRVIQARAGYWPTIDAVESWQRGTQPVFVFSSLLAQRRFTASDFALDALNHPGALDNFRSALTIEQPLFDAAAMAQVRAAGVGRAVATAGRQVVDQDLALRVTDIFGQVLAASAARRSAGAAVATAIADRERAANRRDAGLATDADVLQIDVVVARTREREIQAAAAERIARTRLNEVMGEPLGQAFALEPPPAAAAVDARDVGALEATALDNRPEVKLAALQEDLARAGESAARAAFLPRVALQGGWEINGGTWPDRASSWVVGAVARVNLFRGFADRARLAEARDLTARRALERTKVRTAARVDVHVALARLDAARASEAVGRDAVAQARESQRIVRDRYEAGLADVASLLRAAEAVEQAEAQQIAAQVAVLTESAALDRALGR